MNNTQRKELAAMASTLQTAFKALSSAHDEAGNSDADFLGAITTFSDVIDDAKSSIQDMAEGEREKFNNMPEGLQGSERGELLKEAADNLDALESAMQELEDELDTSDPEKQLGWKSVSDKFGDVIDLFGEFLNIFRSTTMSFFTPIPAVPTIERKISAVAREIKPLWNPPNYAAKPYLDAMVYLGDKDSMYGQDSAISVVSYFLANASAFRGPKAKALKAELKAICGIK